MAASLAGSGIKMLTLAPIAVLLYFSDAAQWSLDLTTTRDLSLLALGFVLFALGAVLKRKVLGVAALVSSPSVPWGVLLLACSGLLYVAGSFSPYTAWWHLDSLYLLVVAYVAARIGVRILRALAPLLVTLGLCALPVALLSDYGVLGVAMVALASWSLFDWFLEWKTESMILPTAMIVAASVGWFYPIWFVAPLLVALLVIGPVRRYVFLDAGTAVQPCAPHSVAPNGFCSICGRMVGRSDRPPSFGYAGLAAVLLFTAVLLLATVPVLAIISGSPQALTYTARGVTSSPIPSTPQGWQVNSTTRDNYTLDVYAVQNVYVTVYHPEVSNYTLYYGLSLGYPTSAVPNGDIPGWRTLSNNFTYIGPFHGYVTSYRGPQGVMMVFSGTTNMVFLQGTSFTTYEEGIGFVRQFTSSNLSADDAQFLGDLNAIWMPEFTSVTSHSVWTGFLDQLDAAASSSEQLLMLLVSIPVMSWVAYRALKSDHRIDEFVTRASTLSEGNWIVLLALMRLRGREGTGREVLGETDADHRALPSLRSLEDMRLVRRSLATKEGELLELWKVNV